MKKLLIILLMLFPLAAESATITATKAGNWSDTSVWDLGRIPAAGDDVALAGYVIVWDTALVRIPSTSGTLTSISSTGTAGQISLALDDAAFHGGASLYVTTMTAGTKPSTAGLLLVTGTTDHVLSITTGTGAGEGIIGGSNTSASGVSLTGTGTINIFGNIKAGTGAYANGVNNVSTGTIAITGNVSADSGICAYGVRNHNNGTLTISGNINGAAAAGAYGVYTYLGTVTINGGTVTGGSYGDAVGIYNDPTASGAVTLSENTNLIYGTYAPPILGKAPIWQPKATSYIKMYVGTTTGQAANTEFKIPQTTGSAQ
jgi:hypothetical protein